MTFPIRHIEAATVTCACCRDTLHPSEFGQTYAAEFQRRVDALHSGPVCDACTDHHATCPQCGRMHDTEDSEAQDVSTGETVCSPDCRDEFEAEEAEERRFRG